MSLKEAILKMLFPLSGVMIVILIFNFQDLTFKSFVEIILITFAIAVIGGGFLYLVSKLYSNYEARQLVKIIRKFKEKKINDKLIKLNFEKIEFYCELRSNFRTQQNEFTFHVPRMYIKKKFRKDFKYIKPSSIGSRDCFQILSKWYITNRNLSLLEKRLNLITEKYSLQEKQVGSN